MDQRIGGFKSGRRNRPHRAPPAAAAEWILYGFFQLDFPLPVSSHLPDFIFSCKKDTGQKRHPSGPFPALLRLGRTGVGDPSDFFRVCRLLQRPDY